MRKSAGSTINWYLIRCITNLSVALQDFFIQFESNYLTNSSPFLYSGSFSKKIGGEGSAAYFNVYHGRRDKVLLNFCISDVPFVSLSNNRHYVYIFDAINVDQILLALTVPHETYLSIDFHCLHSFMFLFLVIVHYIACCLKGINSMDEVRSIGCFSCSTISWQSEASVGDGS